MQGALSQGFIRPKKVLDNFVPSYWGTGEHGILTGDDAIILHGAEEWDTGVDFITYSGFAVRQYTQINWDPASPVELTVDAPCRGLILFSQGDVYIGPNATVSMAKKGSILPCHPEELLQLYGTSRKMMHIVEKLLTLKGGTGGNGGNGQGANATGGSGGTGGLGRICQGGRGAGGGAPAYYSERTGGNGGSIVSPEAFGYSGARMDASSSPYGYNGFNGGAGGVAVGYNTSAYPGSPGIPFGAGAGAGALGIYTNGVPGGDGEYTGGFIMIIAKGNLTISGTLDVTGGNGGDGGTGDQDGGGGGGAGGGVIAIFAKGIIDTSVTTIIFNGGAGGTGYENGTAGGPGTFYYEQI